MIHTVAGKPEATAGKPRASGDDPVIATVVNAAGK